MSLHLPILGRLRRRRLTGRDEPDFPVPFVVGAPRSGTTLLRLMLDAHPEVAIPSETHFIRDLVKAFKRQRMTPDSTIDLVATHRRWGDFHLDRDELYERFRAIHPFNAPDAIRAFYRLYAEHQGKPRWGDKTPGYMKDMRRVGKALPEAHFIHLIRDGRDVALSIIPMNWGPDTIEDAAASWWERIALAREHVPYLSHYQEIHFEDLVLDTEATVRKVCDYLELEFDPAMLDYPGRAKERLREKQRDLHRPKGTVQPAALRMASHALAAEAPRPDRVGRWREEMSPAEVARYEAVAGEMLEDLGYETGAMAPTEA